MANQHAGKCLHGLVRCPVGSKSAVGSDALVINLLSSCIWGRMILDSSVNLFKDVFPFPRVHFTPLGFGRDLEPWALGVLF